MTWFSSFQLLNILPACYNVSRVHVERLGLSCLPELSVGRYKNRSLLSPPNFPKGNNIIWFAVWKLPYQTRSMYKHNLYRYRHIEKISQKRLIGTRTCRTTFRQTCPSTAYLRRLRRSVSVMLIKATGSVTFLGRE